MTSNGTLKSEIGDIFFFMFFFIFIFGSKLVSGGRFNGVAGTSATGLIYVDNAPTWSTNAGSLGSILETATGNHFTISATDPEGKLPRILTVIPFWGFLQTHIFGIPISIKIWASMFSLF